MPNPRKHHFVPQWYLKQFCNTNGMLHVYDRQSKLFRAQSPQKVMKINDYYRQRWAAEGVDQFALERFAGQVLEPKGKLAIEKLLLNPTEITEHEMWWLAIYLAFQRVRVPRQAKQARALVEAYTMTNGDSRMAEALLNGDISISDSVRFEYMKSVLDLMVKQLAGMQWDVLSAGAQSSFITSDSPVTFYNGEFPPPTEAGVSLAGTKILFPISPTRLLLLRHAKYGGDILDPLEAIPPPAGPNVDISITVYPDPIQREKVEMFNGLVYIQSGQVVVGNCTDALKRSIDSGAPILK